MRVIIVGGIAAGMSAAAKLRRVDKEAEIIVFEKKSYVSFGACGLPYYIGDMFEEESRMFARTPEKLREGGIDVRTEHEVLTVDAKGKSITVKDLTNNEVEEFAYDKLMVATGAMPVIPPIKKAKELKQVYVVRSMEDGRIIKEQLQRPDIKKVAIVGAGFIGLEMAEAAMHQNKQVSVYQLEKRILPDGFDEQITDVMEAYMREQGVDLHLDTKVVALDGVDNVQAVVTEQGTFEADLVILSTGVRPNTQFMVDTGVEMLPNGAILVDRYGKTSLEDIYAAGDCAAIPHLIKKDPVYVPLATGANKLGRIVGENLGGKMEVYEGTLASGCLKFLDMEAGRTGLTEEEAKKEGLSYKTTIIQDRNQTDYYPDQQPIQIKLVYEADKKVLLGGQIIGKKGAVLRVDVLAAAITAKMTTKQLGMLDLCYAPPFARTWDALNVAGNVAK